MSGDPRGRCAPSLQYRVQQQRAQEPGANVNLNGSTGTPYSVRTGRDENGASVFNDRPEGVRNTERTAMQLAVNINLNYMISFGRGSGGGPPMVGIVIAAPGAALRSPFFGQPTMVLNPRKIDFGVNFGF
jgi:hypothetical protein